MKFAQLISDNSSRVLWLGALVSLLCLPLLAGLRIETNLAALLPNGSPAADSYRLFLERFGGFEKVFIMVLPEEGEEVEAADLSAAAEEIQAYLEGHEEVRAVRLGLEAVDEDFLLRFVVRRAPLLSVETAPEQLAARLTPEAVERRVARLRADLRRPGGGAEIPLHRHDPLGFREFLPTLSQGAGGVPMDPFTGVFMAPGTAPGEGAALLIVTPTRAEIDPAGGRALEAAIEAACQKMRAEIGTHLVCSAVGGPLYAAQDEAALRSDLRTTITGSLVGCTLILLLALGGWRLPLVTLLVLVAALLWTGAFFTLLAGRLNALSLGFAAVLVGLGVDYGIHGSTRFRQERLGGSAPRAALLETFRHAGPAILTSALTTAIAFGTLALAHFRPLRQLGLLVAVGILAILVATATVGAAWLLRISSNERGAGWKEAGQWGTLLWQGLGWVATKAPASARKRPGMVLLTVAVLSVGAGVGVGRLELDTDLRRLRPDGHPALQAEVLLERHFKLGSDTSTLLVPGEDLDEVLHRASAAAQLLRQAEPHLALTSPADWLLPAGDKAARLDALRRLPWARAAADLERSLQAAGLAPSAFAPGLEALHALAEGKDPGAPEAADWPQPLAELLRWGPEEAMAAVQLRLPADTWSGGIPAHLEQALQGVAPGSSMASAVALGSELRGVAGEDVRRLGGVGLAFVALVVLLSFRFRLSSALMSLIPVSLGSLWTFGLAGACGIPLDLFGLAVLPILLGIGIDDGLHALHGSRWPPSALAGGGGAGEGSVAKTVEGAGRAMALTTLTTAVGFLSLGISRIPALRTGGVLISLGVFCCLLATLFVLPAVEAWREKRFTSTVGSIEKT